MNDLPPFVQVLSALLTPTIAIVGTIIAYQQWRTNNLKLKLDLYDRRLKVYEEVRVLLSRILQKADINYDELFKFFRNCSEADFLFGPEIPKYIEELYQRGVKLHSWNEQYRDSTQPRPPNYNHKIVVEGKHEELQWFTEQFDPAKRLFQSYLSIK